MGHTYMGHTYTRHVYTDHNYIGHNYILCQYRSYVALRLGGTGAVPVALLAQHSHRERAALDVLPCRLSSYGPSDRHGPSQAAVARLDAATA